MRARLAVALCLCAAVVMSHGERAAAQADVHARAIARASCQNGKHSEAVVDATAAVEKDPDEIGPRMRLADILVDQGCYQEAVDLLDAVQESHPRNAELSAKLRDVRSLVTEQTYIEDLTQAAEGAKFARNQLRCNHLADLGACDDALKSKPDDIPLLIAKGDALLQVNRVADAVTMYRHALQLKPADEAIKGKLSTAEALQAKLPPATTSPAIAVATAATRSQVTKATLAAARRRGATDQATAPLSATAGSTPTLGGATGMSAMGAGPGAERVASATTNARAPSPNGGQHATTTSMASAAALSPPDRQTYSNDAPPGHTN